MTRWSIASYAVVLAITLAVAIAAGDLRAAGAKSNTPQISPSKQETITAIEEIFSGQQCSKAWGEGTPVESDEDLEDFRFVANESEIGFGWRLSFSNPDASRSQHLRKVISFNPSDISQIEYYEDRRFGVPLLKLSCVGARECINTPSGNSRLHSDSAFIAFCEATTRDRVYSALKHLQQFYQPSKRQPF
jgi:hypothetical protein